MIGRIAALASGLLFALGLTIAGMTLPAKVIGFLDFTGDWDPSLALVMGSALAVMVPTVAIARRLRAPVAATQFHFPRRTEIDARLIVGSVLFGVGWGVSGFCPGPAVASFGALRGAALVFFPSMLVGMYAFHRWDARRSAVANPMEDARDDVGGDSLMGYPPPRTPSAAKGFQPPPVDADSCA